jgi:uncharacterized protein
MASHSQKSQSPRLGIASTNAPIYRFRIDTDRTELVRLRVTLPRLSHEFHGYKLVQFSDIHMGTGMTPERLARVIDTINAQEPDLIVNTGDFVSFLPVEPLVPELVTALQRLRAKDDSVAILGNHDHHTDATTVRRIIRESGMIEVSNAVHTIRRGEAMLHIAGVDDYWYHQDQLDRVIDVLPDEGTAILLAHEPDFADISAATGRFDLQLSGHSHGGQIVMPFFRTTVLPRYAQKYPAGRYQVGSMIQYTNRGVGTVVLPIRINCRPEITVFTLESPEK